MPDFTQYACPVCGQKFHASDDVVVCPQCGAPHHRTCWKEEGRCHFQSAHGTPSSAATAEPSTPTGGPAAKNAAMSSIPLWRKTKRIPL